MRALIAIALLLLRELGRRRIWIPVILIGAMAFFAPLLGARAGTGSYGERYHLLVLYGIGLPGFLLTLLGIAVAAGLARDIESRRIHVLVTKPIWPWQIVLGRFLGLMLVCGWLLVCASANLEVCVWDLTEHGDRDPAAGPDQLPIRSFLVPRSELQPELEPLDPSALNALAASMKQEGRGGREVSRGEAEARARRSLRSIQLKPGESTELLFRGVGNIRDTERDGLPVRFVVHSIRPWETGRVRLEWVTGNEGTPSVVRSSSALPGVPCEVLLPGGAVGDDGVLHVRARNAEPADSGALVLLDLSRIRVLRASQSRLSLESTALWLLWWRMGLLFSLGLCAASLFRFPTAVFLTLFVHVSALASGFLRETFELFEGGSRLGGLSDPVGGWASRLGALALEILPDFSRLDPLDRLSSLRAIEPVELTLETLRLAGECAVLLALGGMILRRREIARP